MPQRWTKIGLVVRPPAGASHAALPIAVPLPGGAVRIYFSPRDPQNRSYLARAEVDLRSGDTADPPAIALLGPGTLGAFDDSGVMASWLVDRGEQLFLYYVGWNRSVGVPFRNAIGLATSTDGGATFKRYSDGPIVDRGPFDPVFAASASVLVEGGMWRMWYVSGIAWRVEALRPVPCYHIKYAESRDGISWQRDGRVCIDFAAEGEHAISRPCVVKDGGLYRMWYSYRGAAYRIGYAESPDGLTWRRMDGDVSLDVSERGWDSEMLAYPFVFDHAGERFLLYNGNGYGATGVGCAVLS